MYAIPSYFCVALLGTILLMRENQHNKMIRSLINKLLIKEGFEPMDDEPEPVNDQTKTKLEDVLEKLSRKKQQAAKVRFGIPGMPQFGNRK